MSEDPSGLDKLRIAGIAAPRLRQGIGRSRKIKTIDKDGNVVREIDAVQLAQSLQLRIGIEYDLNDAVEKKIGVTKVACEICKRVFVITSGTQKICKECSFKPCHECGTMVKVDKSRRKKTGKVFCIHHAFGRRELEKCCECGMNATAQSSARARRGEAKAYCVKHNGKDLARSKWPGCAICGQPCTRQSIHSLRTYGTKPKCKEHTNKRLSVAEIYPCKACGKPSSKKATAYAKGRGGNAYCSDASCRANRKKA